MLTRRTDCDIILQSLEKIMQTNKNNLRKVLTNKNFVVDCQTMKDQNSQPKISLSYNGK